MALDSQPFPAFNPSSFQNPFAGFSGIPFPKTMASGSFPFLGLIGSLGHMYLII